ncbi:DUF397 domain-containing protein [Streptomyces sp. NPDC046215]|uniref:DUF397 domain-containing protein n=1 Tax=Streptomyces stramineus TaxID=173861 RepID=A0ABN1ADN3_9ACTN
MSAMPRYVPTCGAVWRRSSYSTGMNNCVETAGLRPGLLAVRDSKNTARPALLFSPVAWTSFVGGLRDGRIPLSGRSAG